MIWLGVIEMLSLLGFIYFGYLAVILILFWPSKDARWNVNRFARVAFVFATLFCAASLLNAILFLLERK